MIDLLQTLVVCATVIYLAERGLRVWLGIRSKTTAPEQATPLPADIVKYAESFGAGWASESVTKRAQELYQEFKDWAVVRRKLEQEAGE